MDIETLTIKQIKEYVKVLEQIAEDRDTLLAAIPECPMHGPCMPHALEWINKQGGKMSKPAEREISEIVSEYWVRHYVNNDACSLCGNSGVIHTEAARTASGKSVGRANYCICPNGQAYRESEKEQENG